MPSLRELFNQVFGEQTASNNAGWLRRKLAESPDSVHGQRRSLVVRARDMGAAIWNSPLLTPGGQQDDPEGFGAAADAAVAERLSECGEGGAPEGAGLEQKQVVTMTDAVCYAQLVSDVCSMLQQCGGLSAVPSLYVWLLFTFCEAFMVLASLSDCTVVPCISIFYSKRARVQLDTNVYFQRSTS